MSPQTADKGRAWLHVIGIGEGGLAEISHIAEGLIAAAELLVGGERHLAMVPKELSSAERLTWAKGLRETYVDIAQWRGHRVVVLASGDPFCYGVATSLRRHFDAGEMFVLPTPSAFSLTCARMKWSVPDTTTFTVHGRPVEKAHLHIAPGAQLVTLSRDGDSPAELAALLRERGFGPSKITVFEAMGGENEARVSGTAEAWGDRRCADLNTVAIECIAGPKPILYPLVPGLPNDLFEHDGQLTKREVRAVTLSSLAPQPGQTLWDIGAGSGSIAIEFMRAVRDGMAVALERDESRLAAIARNAFALGTPRLKIVAGSAPAGIDQMGDAPDRIFVGGGISHHGVLERCWEALAPGGRLVANTVTVEAESRLLAFQDKVGGRLVRIAISHEQPVGRLRTLKPMAPVTQLIVDKP